jgi:hypothetical protein
MYLVQIHPTFYLYLKPDGVLEKYSRSKRNLNFTGCNCSEPLLTCSIPNLEHNLFSIKLYGSIFKINAATGRRPCDLGNIFTYKTLKLYLDLNHEKSYPKVVI